MSIFVWSTLLSIVQRNVRVNVGVAVLVTVRSLPTQTVTVWLSEPVVAVSFVVNVAMFV